MSQPNPAAFPATSMPDQGWWPALFPDPAAILAALGIRPGLDVLDLCCGDGHFTAPLARLVDGRLYALDLDPALVAQAKASVSAVGASARRWFVADAREADALLPEPVDYVLFANTLHGVADRDALIATIARCLRPGGRVGLLNWRPLDRADTIVLGEERGPPTERRMPPGAAIACLSRGGFAIDPVIDVPPYYYGLIGTLR